MINECRNGLLKKEIGDICEQRIIELKLTATIEKKIIIEIICGF